MQAFGDPRSRGSVNPEKDAVYLPLENGSNELILALSELGGGWGFLPPRRHPAKLNPVISEFYLKGRLESGPLKTPGNCSFGCLRNPEDIVMKLLDPVTGCRRGRRQ